MTMLEGRHNGATAPATDLTDADKAIMARAEWHESGGTLTGRELAERHGMSPRWGQKQRAAARAETAPDRAAAAQVVPRVSPGPASPPRERKRTPAAHPAPFLLRFTSDLGSLVVIVVCAVVSYMHIRHLATVAGIDSAAWAPLGIDGLMAVCTCKVISDRQAKRPPLRTAQIGLVAGIVGTLVANALAVEPELVPMVYVRIALACYPALAVTVILHVLYLRMAGER